MVSPALIGQSITIVDKSGNIIKQSKTLYSVFKDAKAAYQERKAEIKDKRYAELEERRAQRGMKAMQISDERLSRARSERGGARSERSDRSDRSDRHRHHHSRGERRDRDGRDRDTRSVASSHRSRSDAGGERRRRSEGGVERRRSHRDGSDAGGHRRSPRERGMPDLQPIHEERGQVTRRHTDAPLSPVSPRSPHSPRSPGGVRGSFDDPPAYEERPRANRSRTMPASDAELEHLAYGDSPPSPRLPIATRDPKQEELKGLMSNVTMILDEAHCLQHSVTQTIANLQKNPDALAAVALSLAEISTLVKTLAPGGLMAMKSAFPAVFAMLAAPEFLIAVGVTAGVTVVALGGYKIIKRIRAKHAENAEDEMIEMGVPEDVSRIETWRRGIQVGEHPESVGTSVDGEFITPAAARERMTTEERVDFEEGLTAKKREKRKAKVKKGKVIFKGLLDAVATKKKN